jgi:formate dehydrogenase assembly factor FdhD
MRTYFRVRGGRLDEVKGEVVREQPLTIDIDGERFLTLLCSPFDLEPLVLGYRRRSSPNLYAGHALDLSGAS